VSKSKSKSKSKDKTNPKATPPVKKVQPATDPVKRPVADAGHDEDGTMEVTEAGPVISAGDIVSTSRRFFLVEDTAMDGGVILGTHLDAVERRIAGSHLQSIPLSDVTAWYRKQ